MILDVEAELKMEKAYGNMEPDAFRRMMAADMPKLMNI